MKAALYLSTVLLIVLISFPLHGQVLTITASGTITSFEAGTYPTTNPLFSASEIGTPFTVTYTVHLSASTGLASQDYETFDDTSGTSSANIGGTILSTNGSNGALFSNNPNTFGFSNFYGYELDSPEILNISGLKGVVLDISVGGGAQSILPTLSVGSISQVPLSSFSFSSFTLDGDLNVPLGQSSPSNEPFITGAFTSFSVEESPEPSRAALMLNGLMLLAFLYGRRYQANLRPRR